MRLISIILLTGMLIGGSWQLPTCGHAAELRALLDAPDTYDGQQVSVTGTASAPRFNESLGKPFTVFELTDHTGHAVRIFSWTHLTLNEGDLVAVEGTFVQAKQVGRHTIHNEIEARTVRLLSEHH
jgi:hypothetical protein